MVVCQICGIRGIRKDGEKRIFMARFPLDEARCREWVKVVGKEDLVYVPIEKLHANKYICENHFDKKAFKDKKTQLRSNAVPYLNLKADPLPDNMLQEFPCHVYKETCELEESNAPSIPAPLDHDYLKYRKKTIQSLQRKTLKSQKKSNTFETEPKTASVPRRAVIKKKKIRKEESELSDGDADAEPTTMSVPRRGVIKKKKKWKKECQLSDEEKREQRYCIKFCQKLGDIQAEVIRKMEQAFGDNAMSTPLIRKWYNRFKNGCKSVDNQPRSDKSLTSPNKTTKEREQSMVLEDHHVAVEEPANDSFGRKASQNSGTMNKKQWRLDIAQNIMIADDERWVFEINEVEI